MGGEGPRGVAVSATPVAPPPAPQEVVAVAGNKEVTLSWSAADGAAAYNVYRGTSTNKQATIAVATVCPHWMPSVMERLFSAASLLEIAASEVARFASNAGF